jgi:hypothetical protein
MLKLDVSQPLWPLVAIPVALLGAPWLIETISGWLG